MAPRVDETAFVAPADDAVLDIQNDKIELQEAPEPEAQAQEQTQESIEEQGPMSVDPFVSGTANFCSNFFCTLLGKTKVCEHCNQTILNSESRVKEMAGETKSYFHTECKSARIAAEEKKKALHQDLATFFEIKESKARNAEGSFEKKQKALHKDLLAYFEIQENMAQKAEAERQAALQAETARAIEVAPPARKKGLFGKLFSGCRSKNAVISKEVNEVISKEENLQRMRTTLEAENKDEDNKDSSDQDSVGKSKVSLLLSVAESA